MIERRWILLVCLLSAAVGVRWRTANGHHLDYTLAQATIGRDGTIELSLQFHVAAYVFEQEPGILPSPERARIEALSPEAVAQAIADAERRLADAIEVRFGERIADIVVTFPTGDAVRADALVTEPVPSPPVRVRLNIPPRARDVDVVFPPRLGRVMLEWEQNGAPPNFQPLRPGERSWPYVIRARGDTGDDVDRTWWARVRAYVVLGFEHIIPEGMDHVLFVLGLFLMPCRWRALVAQVTAFTLAHSVTLGLAVYDVVSLPSAVVEPLIAISIAYIAIENLLAREMTRWRPAVVFAFGLLHGLGFAGVLRGLGISTDDVLPALLGFNVGVELGQLAVLAGAFLLVGWFRGRDGYRNAVVVPLSCLIGFTGVYWAATRVLDSLAA